MTRPRKSRARAARALAMAMAMTTTAALSAGCYNVTYVAKTRTASAVVHEQKLTFFVAGLVGEQDVQAGQLCPGGVARVRTRQTFADLLLTVVTLTIYAPRTAEVTCAQ